MRAGVGPVPWYAPADYRHVVLSAVLLVITVCLGGLVAREMRRRRHLEVEVADLRERARVEDATMLGNHRAFTEDLEREIMRADRTGRPASLVVASVDSGPDAVAQAIRSELRSVDAGYRIGADEFAIILPETRARGALLAAGRIEDKVLACAPTDGITAGIAELGPGIDRHQLFRNAYRALLAAGRDGRPRLLVYAPELEETAPGRGSPERPRSQPVDGPVV